MPFGFFPLTPTLSPRCEVREIRFGNDLPHIFKERGGGWQAIARPVSVPSDLIVKHSCHTFDSSSCWEALA